MIKRGDRVLTPEGRGTVAYVRLAPPHYSTVEAASIFLDRRRLRPGYGGTMFLITDLRLEAKDGPKANGA